MRIACLGGGPAGLYFAIAMKLRDPAHDITVVERNRPYDTFGWGVVLSDETLANLRSRRSRQRRGRSAARSSTGTTSPCTTGARSRAPRDTASAASAASGCSISCRTAPRPSASSSSSRPRFDSLEPYRGYDLIVAADGANSKVRTALAHVFKPDIDVRACKYIWLGTHQKFDDAFTFIFEETEHGWIWAHAYQFDAETATFIVECSEATWRRFGFDQHEPGRDHRHLRAHLRQIPRRQPPDDQCPASARLGMAQLPRACCARRWSHENIVLMGDAAATAHFSVGSGTKLALESAIALAGYLHSEPTMQAAFQRYEDERRTEVLRAAERGAQLDRVVRGRGALSPSRSGAVQLFAADALAAHQPREPARSATRPGWTAPRCGSSSRPPATSPTPRARRCSRRSGCATCT